MSRFEKDFADCAPAQLGMTELLRPYDPDGQTRKRCEAIACVLSGGEGWRNAVETLGGSFASDAAKGQG